MDLGPLLTDRLTPVATPGFSQEALVIIGVAALAVILIPTLWLRLRIAVTLVHELGHAIVGILSGRRFTGFVVRGDMSGHAVTVGPARGFGRIATTWAGYPMPALVGALMVWAATSGYAAALLFATLLTLVAVLVFVRSAGTFAVVVVGGAAVGAAWWWREDAVQGLVVAATGLVLLIGGWRHLGAVATQGQRNSGSDSSVLRQLTGIPAAVWVVTFAAIHAAATWWCVRLLLDLA